MSNEDSICSPNVEQLLEMCENEIRCLESENLKMRKCQDEAVKTKTSLCDFIVTQYRQMETEHQEAEEKLRMTKIENAHFKSVTKYLQKLIEEMIDRDDVDGILKNNHSSNDNVGLLEELGKTLTRKFCENKTRAEKISKKLDHVIEELNKSQETEKRLKNRVDSMEATRVRRDRETAEWRSMEKNMLDELENSRLVEHQLHVALAQQDDECALVEQSAAEDGDRLRAEISRLTDDLVKRRVTENVLHARVVELEAESTSPSHQLGQSSFCFVDIDQRPRDRSQSTESWKSLDRDAEGTASELGRGDANPRRLQSDDEWVSSSLSDDDLVTSYRKPIGGSLSVADSSVAPEQKIPEWLEVMNKYLTKPATDDDDDDDDDDDIFQNPPSVLDLHTVELIKKYDNRKEDASNVVGDYHEDQKASSDRLG